MKLFTFQCHTLLSDLELNSSIGLVLDSVLSRRGKHYKHEKSSKITWRNLKTLQRWEYEGRLNSRVEQLNRLSKEIK